MTDPGRILIVDDERDFARGLARLVAARFPDAAVETAFSGEEAMAALAVEPFEVMLTDLRMSAMNGLELLTAALESRPDLTVIMLTAHGTIGTAVEALKAGAYDFITKPVEGEDLCRTLGKALERSRLLSENKSLRALVGDSSPILIGRSPAMEAVRERIAAVAQTDYTVLVLGESGTGKELAARMVHHLSPRAERPFVSVNCPAIPDELLESELFGHVKGAFSGAGANRAGLFMEADTGTILLDEIGDISPAMQTKLLRCLQEGEVRPVGRDTSSRIDVRVVASTNQDLNAKVEAKTFRDDLYYRLNVLSIHLPPLREHPTDIPLLARTFMLRTCTEMAIPEKQMDPEVLAHLAGQSWPGNARQLQNAVRRLAVFAQGDRVTMQAVRLIEAGGSGAPAAAIQRSYKDAKNAALGAFTMDYVEGLLRQCSGNVSEAARTSGLTRVALQKILLRHGIAAERFRG